MWQRTLKCQQGILRQAIAGFMLQRIFFSYVKLKISWVFILGAVELADVGISVKVSVIL